MFMLVLGQLLNYFGKIFHIYSRLKAILLYSTFLVYGNMNGVTLFLYDT